LDIRILKDKANPRVKVVRESLVSHGRFAEGCLEGTNFPFRGEIEPVEKFEKSRFSGTVGSKNGDTFPGLNDHIEGVECDI
jgi:hypothetical protein